MPAKYNWMAFESSKERQSWETGCGESLKYVEVEKPSETGFRVDVKVEKSEESLQVGKNEGPSRGEEEEPVKCGLQTIQQKT